VTGTTGCAAGERAGDWNEAAAGASNSGLTCVDTVARHPSHVAVPVVYNRRMLYLHAVCLACLGALQGTDDPLHGARTAANHCGTSVSVSRLLSPTHTILVYTGRMINDIQCAFKKTKPEVHEIYPNAVKG